MRGTSTEKVANGSGGADGGAGLRIPPSLADLVGYHLRIAQEASFNAFAAGAGAAGLKPGWYTLLTVVAENPGLTPTEISRLVGRDRSTLTSTLKALDGRGLIARKANATDGRSYGVSLTPAGHGMLKKLKTIARAHDARLDAIVGGQKAALIAVLRRIVEGLEED
ncbi:MarR family transcriptional regulator [Rhodoplanes sp. TEM]|uniref:MarR family transcriptional regulator n=1 Tax=Rhodoplanes tepidamans TaxID=200616 RepID=A0ABT5JAR4_RHOTP|nr:MULTISPECIES: MarR family transcriptional regulator [Rhodoplanes]MDC7786737.1 MarR family transcriptional regulator [Rhodoplanes tepidamans]MDC7983743.1 MarR family transcriptional regulator [Rhodoplanes sp. TEM]MDQ0358174.1 DNA-binding MarR family transcriptional regulator [Rhodoplanes tepidamans]